MDYTTLFQEYVKERLTNAKSRKSITQEESLALLSEVSNVLYPVRKLLRIQIDGKDAKLIKSDESHHDDDFVSAFAPSEMHILALASHNEMKATMKRFVIANKNVLKKFRLTGTNSTMTMLREVFKGDPDVIFGPACTSGPLGGDAELAALMTQGCVGGMIFFQDPMSAHPHQADIESLCRLALVHNTMISNNPTTALMMMDVIRTALKGGGNPALIPSFFFNLMSPSVPAYKAAQQRVIQKFVDEASAASSDASIVRLTLDKSRITKLIHGSEEDQKSRASPSTQIAQNEVADMKQPSRKPSDSMMSVSSISMSESGRQSSFILSELVGSLKKKCEIDGLTSSELKQLGEVKDILSMACAIPSNPTTFDSVDIFPQDYQDDSANTSPVSAGNNNAVKINARIGPLASSARTTSTFRDSTLSDIGALSSNFQNHEQKVKRHSFIKKASLFFKSCRSINVEL